MKTRHPFRFVLSVSLALALLTLLLALAGTAAGQPAGATIIITNTNDSGPGSLRQAIRDVEAGGTIRFDPSLAGGRILLTSGQLVISQSLTIDASAAVSLTVDGDGASRVFFIAEGATVDVVALTITGGQAPVNDEGSISHGGGILNMGNLTLSGCSVIENRAGHGRSSLWNPSSGPSPAMPGGDGGGIFNTGRVILRNTTVLSNTAGSGGPSVIGPQPGAHGGNGGGIFNGGVLMVADSVVEANHAGDGGGVMPNLSPGDGGHGGGLYSTGTMTITRSLLANNGAGNGHTEHGSYSIHFLGSQGGDGGGIYSASSGRLVLIDSTLRSNRAGSGEPWQDRLGRSGGGVYNGGSALVTHSVFISNRAGESQDHIYMTTDGGDGGAIANRGVLTLRDSVLDGNAAGVGHWGGSGGAGGGLWNHGVAHLIDSAVVNNSTSRGSDGIVGTFRTGGTPGGNGGDGAGLWSDGSLILLRVTVDGNQAGDGGLGGRTDCGAGLAGGDGGRGGGIYTGYSLALDNCTVTGNNAGPAGAGGQGATGGTGGLAGAGGGVNGAFSARDAILAGNSAPGVGPDCAGRLSAGGYNLLQSWSGCTIDPAVVNNVIGHSPALLALALNVPGTTATHALFWGSPAIDAGSCSAGSVTHDQRGVPRPQGAGCDIGAYEFDGTTAGRLLWLPQALRSGTQ